MNFMMKMKSATMNIQEAIEKSREFVLQHVGVDCYPDFVSLNRHVGKPQTWVIVYSPDCFIPNSSAVIDGGETIIEVDYESGKTSFKSVPG